MNLTILDRNRNIPMQILLRTKAFKERNSDFEYMKWSDAEWGECLEEAKSELLSVEAALTDKMGKVVE